MIQNAQLNTAFIHVSRMAEGRNPLNAMEEITDGILNSPEIIRTMFIVKEILENVKMRLNDEYNGTGSEKRGSERIRDERPVEFPEEILGKFRPKRDTTVTHFLHDAYVQAEDKDVRQVAPKTVLDWLMNYGYLESAHDDELGIDYKKVTDKGSETGFRNNRVLNGLGGRNYISVIFDEAAQYFTVANMGNILTGEPPVEDTCEESIEEAADVATDAAEGVATDAAADMAAGPEA